MPPVRLAAAMLRYVDLSLVIARNARALRAAARQRQVDVAARAGLARSTLSLIESGERRITIEDIRALCVGLNVGLRDLLTGAEAAVVAPLRLDDE